MKGQPPRPLKDCTRTANVTTGSPLRISKLRRRLRQSRASSIWATPRVCGSRSAAPRRSRDRRRAAALSIEHEVGPPPPNRLAAQQRAGGASRTHPHGWPEVSPRRERRRAGCLARGPPRPPNREPPHTGDDLLALLG